MRPPTDPAWSQAIGWPGGRRPRRPPWMVLQGTPAVAKAIREVVRSSRERLALALRTEVLFGLMREGLAADLHAAAGRGVDLRVLGEHDRRLRPYYPDLLRGPHAVGFGRLRLLPVAPFLVALRDGRETIYEIVSGEARDRGQPVVVRARSDSAYPMRLAEFDLLWERGVPAEILPLARHRGAGGGRARTVLLRWRCPDCDREHERSHRPD
ncbi:MAG: hypothetical protein QXG65_05175 [Thermoplasmata archaeon]